MRSEAHTAATPGVFRLSPWLDDLHRTGSTWEALAAQAGISVEALVRLRDGRRALRREPRAQTLRKLFAAFPPPDGAGTLVADVERQSQAGRRRCAQKARCTGCGRIESRLTAPVPAGQIPSFTHRRCRQRPITPLSAALEAARSRCGGWKPLQGAFVKAGCPISLPTMHNWTLGGTTENPAVVVRVLASVLAYSPEQEALLLEQCERANEDRRRAQYASSSAAHMRRRGPEVVCAAGCGRRLVDRALVRRVRRQKGSWTCRGCRRRDNQVELRCPVIDCPDPQRFDYQGPKWQSKHSDDLRTDGNVSYYVLRCRPCNARLRGASKRAIDRRNESLFPRFRRWYERSSHATKKDAYGDQLGADEVWDAALGGDVADATPQQREECMEIVREWRPTLLPNRRRRRVPGARRAPSRKKRQGTGRSRPGGGVRGLKWGARKLPKALARCELCWNLIGARASIHRSRFDQECWVYWARSPEYEVERRRRRPGRHADNSRRGTPIHAPVPHWVGRPVEKESLETTCEWALRYLLGETSITALANESFIAKHVVKKAVLAFIRWLPSDRSLTFRRRATRMAIGRRLDALRRLGKLRDTDEARRKQDIERILWLGRRFNMPPELIARRVVGFSSSDIGRILTATTADDTRDENSQLPDETTHDQAKHRLTTQDLQAIRTAPRSRGVNARLAREYGVTRARISQIRHSLGRRTPSSTGVV